MNVTAQSEAVPVGATASPLGEVIVERVLARDDSGAVHSAFAVRLASSPSGSGVAFPLDVWRRLLTLMQGFAAP